MTLRLTSSSLAGTSRNEVAVGTLSEASMLVTMRAPTPLIGSPAGVGGRGVAAGGVRGPSAAQEPGPPALSAEPPARASAAAGGAGVARPGAW